MTAAAIDFEKYKSQKYIIILGGPNAGEGIGLIFEKALSVKELAYLKTPGKRKIYFKNDLWTINQTVILLGGSDSKQTEKIVVDDTVIWMKLISDYMLKDLKCGVTCPDL